MRLWYLLAIMLVMGACGKHNTLVSMEPEQKCWKISNRLKANFEHPGGALKLPVIIELNDDYPFSNLYLNVKMSKPGGIDTSWHQSQTFVDPLGNWLVESSGGVHTVQHTLLTDVVFPAGSYILELGHYMRPERICGVHTISILSN